ncbi:hypothetical protein JMUB6875_24410 [Nocardia sp. JMUB6875]
MIPDYCWRCAPKHLRTRRQLAAEGLRPTGRLVRPRLGGREPLTPWLYDVEQAAPKRIPTTAQLAALARATRERQLRAAERHGIDRREFEQEVSA